MRVIGTAGHVDHGKSTLVAALTGTHPDRLKEEQAREMTIELGFGWITLPNGEEVGIVDVPGHRDFIENMLSGVGGIDAALLVIAADEGVMPQTKEHLAILDLLQIPAGLIVLTKTDLASDSGWLDLVEKDIRAAVSKTVLHNAPILRVSASTKTGLDSLVSNLQSLLADKPSRPDLNRPRLPRDRAFSISGFGTVVTGTLLDGQFSVGDEVEILPGMLKGRIRGLQTHKKKEQVATPGSRTAVNISGVETSALHRGDVLARPNQYTASRRIDAQLRLLRDISSPIKHNGEVKFFTGASETMATIRLLDVEELNPGEEGWVQLELRDPIVTVRGDRYILRRPSPGETLGGGMVIDHQPQGRHKRFDDGLIKSLESLAQGSPEEILLEAAMTIGISPIKDIVTRSRLEQSHAESALASLVSDGSLILLEEGISSAAGDLLIAAASHWNALREKILRMVGFYHRDYPLRRGMPREELKSKLKISPRIFNAAINKLLEDNSLADRSALLAQVGHEVSFNGQEQVKVETLMRRFGKNPYVTPSVKDCQAEVGEEILNALIEANRLVVVSADVIFRKLDYDTMTMNIQDKILQKGGITLAEVRDLFKTSRKYAQALLEHLDATGITVRDGDFRRLKKR
jgi:selenocysteine-specific elongation factor